MFKKAHVHVLNNSNNQDNSTVLKNIVPAHHILCSFDQRQDNCRRIWWIHHRLYRTMGLSISTWLMLVDE